MTLKLKKKQAIVTCLNGCTPRRAVTVVSHCAHLFYPLRGNGHQKQNKGKRKRGGGRGQGNVIRTILLSRRRAIVFFPLPCFPLFCLTLTYQHGSDIASIGRHSSTSRSFLRSHIDDAGCCDMGLYHQYWTRTSLHLWAKIGCSPSPWTNTILVCVDVCMQFTTCWRYANSPIIVFFFVLAASLSAD